jgi:hypothetical protein
VKGKRIATILLRLPICQQSLLMVREFFRLEFIAFMRQPSSVLASGLPNKPVVHREQAIRIPPVPDASASTVMARAPAQVVVRTVVARLMSNCSGKLIFNF